MKNKKTGREKLKRWSWLVKSLSGLLSLIPKSACEILFNIISGMPTALGTLLRYVLIKRIALSCGENIYIARWCTFKNINNLVLGSNVSFHEYCFLDAVGGIEIGSDVSIAHSSSLISFEHTFNKNDTPFKYQDLSLKEIKMGSNIWIACGVRVLSGTYIENNVVVAANAVIKGVIQSGLYAGVPAMKKRDI